MQALFRGRRVRAARAGGRAWHAAVRAQTALRACLARRELCRRRADAAARAAAARARRFAAPGAGAACVIQSAWRTRVARARLRVLIHTQLYRMQVRASPRPRARESAERAAPRAARADGGGAGQAARREAEEAAMVALKLNPHRRAPPAPPRPLLSPVRPGASGAGALPSPHALFPSSPTRKAPTCSVPCSSRAAAAAAAAAEAAEAAQGAAGGWAGPEPLGGAPQWGGPPAALRPQRALRRGRGCGDALTQPRRAGVALEPHAGLVSAGA